MDIARAQRAGLRAHPGALLLFATRPVRSPALLVAADQLLATLLASLLAAGFTPRQAIYAVDWISALIIGHSFAEFGTATVAAPELDGRDLASQLAALRQAGLDSLARVISETAPIDYDQEFDQALTTLLDGLQRRITGQRHIEQTPPSAEAK